MDFLTSHLHNAQYKMLAHRHCSNTILGCTRTKKGQISLKVNVSLNIATASVLQQAEVDSLGCIKLHFSFPPAFPTCSAVAGT